MSLRLVFVTVCFVENHSEVFFFISSSLIVSPLPFSLLPTPSWLCVVREREQPPRFAQPGSFEYEYAMRWKALLEMEKQQFEQVDRNIKEAQEKLEAEMEAAQHEHQVMLMRQGESGP